MKRARRSMTSVLSSTSFTRGLLVPGLLVSGLLSSGLGACLRDDGAAPARLSVGVAPLGLAGVGEVVWDVTVESADGPVWQERVSSSRYGDGHGAFTYVGTCDATANPHTVTVAVVSIADDTGRPLTSPSDWKDPGPLSREVDCAPNADTPVRFDVTIARAAQQGFFDVAVSFRDVFCSAKLDCDDALLHTGDTRGPTVVMGFACTTGDASPTWLYLGDATLTCVDAQPGDGVALAPIVERLSLATGGDGAQDPRPPLVAAWSRYTGREALPEVDKCYWNHAFGLDLAAIGDRRCTFEVVGTASDRELPGGVVPADATWPVITWSAEVVGEGGALCGPNPLDGDGSGVLSGYLPAPPPGAEHPSFAATLACAAPASERVGPIGARCDGADDAVFRATTVDGDAAVAVTVAGVPAARDYRLPAGAALEEGGCCLDYCCAP